MRLAASSVSLGTTVQQGASDSLRIYLDVAWMRLRVGGDGVSGHLLGGATSAVQFVDVMALAALCPAHWYGGGLNREQLILSALLYRVSLALAFSPAMSPCNSLVPPAHSQIGTGAQNEQVHHCENPF